MLCLLRSNVQSGFSFRGFRVNMEVDKERVRGSDFIGPCERGKLGVGEAVQLTVKREMALVGRMGLGS